MKLRTALLSFAACSISFSSFADVTLNLPQSAELVLVNGVNAEGNAPQTLNNGNNQIAFRYDKNYRENGDTHLFRSEVVVMTFSGNDATYTLQLPNISSAYQAQKFNNQPTMSLLSADGSDIPFKHDVLIKNGFQISRDFPQEIAKYNLSTAPAALAAVVTASEIQQMQPVIPATKDNKIDQAYVTKMLNYWYNKADTTTQQSFKASLNK
ncbi:hypothetical protein UB37_05635 [Photobacterium iliopiscarium]|jgi:hypothetical protein|uniref:DUF2057 domain-containing protein n=1 Tax=Photobacterium iliopiscarium TaxID=56192 RepID=A0ABX5GQ25_9GAMM|nr:DUF2057 domain-containing protein [Photobacterium iliopiscarium]KJG14146.1 hypothetical protein UB38_04760 [Photobacterium iliopiscarium]KJG24117.1 hypothetical protein UB37_05635 [Photobacterium iliopiscarium]PST94029.1 DUF2057 domain-containing protein [Photobacterium iliopiscarium]PSU00674.1 DUF2057 domain-containing protein [Photobacterium iliopiscarium]PSV82360.1 DUF2057 domain-containing protein [Photobacterium iliopiscarium]